MFILILFLMITPCYAMDSIGPVFQMSQGISTSREYKPEYDGAKNDVVYVAKSERSSRYYIEKKKDVKADESDKVIVTTTWEEAKE